MHQKINEYLGEINVEGDILIEDCVYGKGDVDNQKDNCDPITINPIFRNINNTSPTIPAILTTQELTELDSMSDSTGSNIVERGASTIHAEINIADANNNAVIDEIATPPPPRTHTLIQKSKLRTLRKKSKTFGRLMK